MTPSLKKRFWKEATVGDLGSGFTVLLDGRGIKTPAKGMFILPTVQLAEAVAQEWQAQSEEVDPASMPMTRRANAAIDKVTPQMREVADMLAEYGGSDLLCYRATHPQELQERQAEAWNPVLDWARETLDAPLVATAGVMHLAQDPQSLGRLADEVRKLEVFPLTAFHDLVTITGSLVLALAAIRGEFSIDRIWELSRLDERWQEEQWGEDAMATGVARNKFQDLKDAFRFYDLSF